MTTRDCARIETLLHLHRDGELTPDEARRVADHVGHCSSCRMILQELRSIDGAIAPVRIDDTLPESDPGVIADIMTGIGKDSVSDRLGPVGRDWIDRLLGIARPVLVTAAFCAIALLCAQETRDAMKLRELEQRLGTAGTRAIDERRGGIPGLQDLLRSTAGNGDILRQEPRRLVAADPMAIVGGGMLGLFADHPGLFDDLARRYPDLAAVTLDDGVDAREESVLRSEGAELLKELEKLMKEGERK